MLLAALILGCEGKHSVALLLNNKKEWAQKHEPIAPLNDVHCQKIRKKADVDGAERFRLLKFLQGTSKSDVSLKLKHNAKYECHRLSISEEARMMAY